MSKGIQHVDWRERKIQLSEISKGDKSALL